MHIAERLFGIHRDTDQETGDPARLPAQIAGRSDKGIEIEYDGEKIFCTVPTRAVKAGQKSLVPARQAQRTDQGRTPINCNL